MCTNSHISNSLQCFAEKWGNIIFVEIILRLSARLSTCRNNISDIFLHYEVADLFRAVMEGCSMVGGLRALHTLKITMIKAEGVSQYGGPQVLFSEMCVN